MSSLVVQVDAEQLARMANMIGALGKNAGPAIARAVNHTGDKARTQMIRALTVQTGLQRKTIVKALRVTKASATKGSMEYRIDSAGGNVSLKYFGARETRAGVSAAPWGARRVFAGTFMRAGWWPERVDKPKWHGQVFRRTGGTSKTGMDAFEKVRSGLFIPGEMVQGATGEAFRAVVDRDLPDRLGHELMRAMGGAG